LQRFEILQIPGVSEFIEINDVVVRLPHCLQHEIATDKSGTACHQDTITQANS